MIDLTECEKNNYDNAKYCHICKNVFGEAEKHRKVRDHDHDRCKFVNLYVIIIQVSPAIQSIYIITCAILK